MPVDKVYYKGRGTVAASKIERGVIRLGEEVEIVGIDYRPQFFICTADVTGTIQLPENIPMALPGDHLEMNVDLL